MVFREYRRPGYSDAMTIVSRPQKGRLAALFGMLLIVAQSLAVAHAYQHDPGAAVDATCASCIIGGQLANGCADSTGECAPELGVVSHEVGEQTSFDTIAIPASRQRGPPA